MALDKLRIMDVLKGKSGIGGKNRKEMGEHKFWSTQPVPQLGMMPFSDTRVNSNTLALR
jgi:glycylpeptide N-tetradecanoyltransferase